MERCMEHYGRGRVNDPGYGGGYNYAWRRKQEFLINIPGLNFMAPPS